MSKQLLNLRNVPDDEADDPHAMLDAHGAGHQKRTAALPMTDLHPFEIVGNVAVFLLVGDHRFTTASKLVASTLAQARLQRHDRLLVVATELTGFDPPGIAARHQMIREWAHAAQGWVRLALVVRPEFIDPERFGVLAAHSFGLIADVFETEADAFAWLQSLEAYPGDGVAKTGSENTSG